MKDSLKNAISLNRKAVSIWVSIWKKTEENGSSKVAEIKIFLKILASL